MGKFKNIHIFVKKNLLHSINKQNIYETKNIFNEIILFLTKQGFSLTFDISCQQLLGKNQQDSNLFRFRRNSCDLIIVVGGDGSILNCIRKTLHSNIPILGIHQGRLGFLADLNIQKFHANLMDILDGKFKEEKRILIVTQMYQNATNKIFNNLAVNDVVLFNNRSPKLIEFQLFIDNEFVLQQRADGLIIASPTGSTAYSLSAGGPIVYPTLKNFLLVPLYPHTLSSRPIIISADSIINLKILYSKNYSSNNSDCHLSFDGQKTILLRSGDQIIIHKHPKEATLIHPASYSYFATLREKLGWNN